MATEFLFQPATKAQLKGILRRLFHDLNKHGASFLSLDSNMTWFLALKLYRSPVIVNDIKDYDVPMLRHDHVILHQLPWDISFQHLILHIDGINHIKKIVEEVNMDIDFIKRALALLQFHGIIIISDIFKFSNIYKFNSETGLCLLHDARVIQSLLEFSCTSPALKDILMQTKAVDMIIFLLHLQPSKAIGQVLTDFIATTPERSRLFKDIDIPRLIAMARSSGVLIRIQEYPVYLGAHPVQPLTPQPATPTPLPEMEGAGSNSKLSIRVPSPYEFNSAIPAASVEDSKTPTIVYPESTAEATAVSPQRYDYSEPLAGGDGAAGRVFNKLSSRGKSIIGQKFLRQAVPTTVADIVHLLDGSMCLDEVCCRYELNPTAVTSYEGVIVLHKNSL